MNKVVFGLVSVLSVVTVAAAQQSLAGTATGMLNIGAEEFTMNRSYAQLEDDVEGNRINGPQKFLKIVLTDAALTHEEASDWFRMAQASRTGKVHGVRLEYDPAKQELFGATVYYIPPSGQGSPTNITLSGKGANHQIQDLKITGDWVSGTALMVNPDKWLDFEESDPPKTYTYKISFRAPILKPTPVSAILTGKDAQKSPQVAVVVAMFTAALKGDLVAVRRYTLPNPMMESFIKSEGEEKAKELMKQSTPNPKTFPAEVQKIIVRGNTATVISKDSNKITTRLKMKLVGKVWKISP